MAPAGEADVSAIMDDATLETPEQKLAAMGAKYLEKAAAHKRSQGKLNDATARSGVLSMEKDALHSEHRKAGGPL